MPRVRPTSGSDNKEPSPGTAQLIPSSETDSPESSSQPNPRPSLLSTPGENSLEIERNLRNCSIFDDNGTESPQVHHHVHHHLHHHHHETPSGSSRAGSAASADVLDHYEQESEDEKENEQLAALWVHGFPKLSKNFYDNSKLRFLKPEKPSNLAVATFQPAQAREFFRVQKVIWCGFFSIVLKAAVRSSNKTVCIKMIRKNCDAEKRKYVLTEQKALSENSQASPFIVYFFSSFQTRMHVYMVLEHLEGGSLDDRMQKADIFQEKVALFYLSEIALGVFFLHKRGVLHRDLKARNVMLRGTGHICIIDFGTCKMDMRNKFTSTLLASRKEMAPEIFHNTMYNKAVDYWSMGIILYTLMHGEVPFHGKTRVDVFKSVTAAREQYRGGISDHAINLCRSLLQKNQKCRLGYDEDSEETMKTHPFFADVIWNRMEKCQYTPPYIPQSEMVHELTEVMWPGISQQNSMLDGYDLDNPRLSIINLDHRTSILEVSSGSSPPVELLSTCNRVGGTPSSDSRRDSRLSMTMGRKAPKRVSVQLVLPEDGEYDSSVSLPAYLVCEAEPFDDLPDSVKTTAESSYDKCDSKGEVLFYKLENLPRTWKDLVLDGFCDCLASMVNCCRLQLATCRGVCCGPEYVEAPVMMSAIHRPSVNLSRASSQEVNALNRKYTPRASLARGGRLSMNEHNLNLNRDAQLRVATGSSTPRSPCPSGRSYRSSCTPVDENNGALAGDGLVVAVAAQPSSA